MDRRLPPRCDSLRVTLIAILLLTGGCFGLVVEQPGSGSERASVFAQWVGGQLLVWILLGFVLWMVRLAARRRDAFSAVLLYRSVLFVLIAFNVQALVRFGLDEPERFNILV